MMRRYKRGLRGRPPSTAQTSPKEDKAVDTTQQAEAQKWCFSIHTTPYPNTFLIWIKGPVGSDNFYRITTQTQELRLQIHDIASILSSEFDTLTKPKPSEFHQNQRPHAETSISPAQATQLKNFIAQTQQDLTTQALTYDETIEPSVCLSNEQVKEFVIDPDFEHRNDYYYSFEQRLKDLYNIFSLLMSDKVRPQRAVRPIFSPSIQLSNMFFPLFDLWKDIKDTVEPYCSNEEMYRDLKQPIYGILHVLLGAGGILCGAIDFARRFINACISREKDDFFELAYPVSWMIEGISNILSGCIQIITSPLLIVKFPLRYMLSTEEKVKALKEKNERPRQQLIMTTAAMLGKIKTQIQDAEKKEGDEDNENNCNAVSGLLTEIKLGPAKFEYRSKLQNNTESSLFEWAEWTANDLIAESVATLPTSLSTISMWNRVNQVFHNTLSSLSDIEEVGRSLDKMRSGPTRT